MCFGSMEQWLTGVLCSRCHHGGPPSARFLAHLTPQRASGGILPRASLARGRACSLGCELQQAWGRRRRSSRAAFFQEAGEGRSAQRIHAPASPPGGSSFIGRPLPPEEVASLPEVEELLFLQEGAAAKEGNGGRPFSGGRSVQRIQAARLKQGGAREEGLPRRKKPPGKKPGSL